MATSVIKKTIPYAQYLLGEDSTTHTISIASNAHYLIIGTSSATSRCFASIVIAYNSGAVHTLVLEKGSDVTFDTSVNNALKITTGTSGSVDVLILSIASYTKPNETIT